MSSSSVEPEPELAPDAPDESDRHHLLARRRSASQRPSVDLSRRCRRRRRAAAAIASSCAARAAAPLGHALYSDRSQIALRMLTHGDEPGRRCARFGGASRRRSRSGERSPSTRPPIGWCTARPICCRRSSSIATATTWSSRRCRRGWIGCCRSSSSMLQERLQPRGILARNDPRTRLLEGLEQKVEVLAGDVPEMRSPVDRERHRGTTSICGAARRPDCFSISARTAPPRRCYARGRLLDCFSYNGGFALRSARRCRGDDRDRHLGGRRRARAGRTPRATASPIDARVGNVFDELRGLERLGERFDTIVLDPPAFAKNKAAVDQGAGRLQGNQPARAEAAEPGRHARDLQLLVQRQRRRRSRRSCTRPPSTRRRT